MCCAICCQASYPVWRQGLVSYCSRFKCLSIYADQVSIRAGFLFRIDILDIDFLVDFAADSYFWTVKFFLFLCFLCVNHVALRKAKIVCNFGLPECSRVKLDCIFKICIILA